MRTKGWLRLPHCPPERGAAAAEFAAVAGLLLVVLLSLLELAIIANAQTVVAAAAREGARQAAVQGGDSDATRATVTELLQLAGLPAGAARVTVQPRRAGYGRPIRVSIEVPYTPRTPLLRQLAGRVLWLRGEVVTRNERNP